MNPLAMLRDSDEPTACALAFARAVRQHVIDLQQDDPGDDDDDLHLLARARAQAEALVQSLEALTSK